MLFVVSDFRIAFPEFGDTAKYPDSLILNWGTFAESQVNARYWKSATLKGIQLYTAHEVTLEAQSQAAANVGGVPGQQSGPANTKTVGSVSVGYDTTSTSEKDAGFWNLTVYGKQFIRLARIYGRGVVQL